MRAPITLSSSARAGALVFAACLVPRVAAVTLVARPAPNFYWRIADSLLATGTFALDGVPSGAYEPLYPAFLALARWITGDRFAAVMLIQALLASAAGVLFFQLVERRTSSRGAAAAAALCYALYPYYVRQSAAPIELTLSVVLLIGAAWQYERANGGGNAAVIGTWMALLLLLRTMFLPVWVAALVILALRGRRRDAVVVAAVTLALVALWAALSGAQGRAAVPSRVGENLYVSTCEPAGQIVPLHDVDLLVRHAHRAVDADRIAASVPSREVERAVDAALLRAAIRCAREQPLDTVRLKLRNLAYTFSPRLLPADVRLPRPRLEVLDGHARLFGARPRPSSEAVPHLVAHAAITIGALAGLWIRRRRLREDALLLAMLANTALVYAIFFPTTRLVAPTAFVLMFYAGVGITATTAAARRRP